MATANTATTPTDMGTRRTRPADPRSWSAPLKSSIRPTFASTSVLPSSIVEDAVHDAHSIPVGAHMPALINPLDAINLRQEEEDLFRSEIDNINFKVYNIGQLKSIYDTAAYQLPRWSVDFGQKFSDIVQQVAYFRITGTWLPLPPVPVAMPTMVVLTSPNCLFNHVDFDIPSHRPAFDIARPIIFDSAAGPPTA
ncbi:unnamed protein product [Tilletia caries]|nr:unnamed protein product [Tilletia caries]